MSIGTRHRRFQAHPVNRMKKRRTKPSQCFASHIVWILFQAAPVKNVWPPSCLFSGLRISLLRSDREAKFVRAQVVKGRQHHLSPNIGPAIAGSAGPVPPALRQHHLSPNIGPAIAGSAGPVPPALGGKGLWGREKEERFMKIYNNYYYT